MTGIGSYYMVSQTPSEGRRIASIDQAFFTLRSA